MDLKFRVGRKLIKSIVICLFDIILFSRQQMLLLLVADAVFAYLCDDIN